MNKKTTVVYVFAMWALACMLAMPVLATDYKWAAGATARAWDLSYWTNSAGGGPLSNAPYVNAADTGTATNGQINVVANTTFAGQLNIGAGNKLYLNDGNGTGNNIHLTGGVFYVEGYGASDLKGAVSVDAKSYLESDTRNGDKRVSATLSGSADLERRTGTTTLKITGANSSYGGNWIISGGSLQFLATAACGTGNVSVESGGTLVFATGVVVTNLITFKAGSTGDLPNYCYAPTGMAVRLDGGKIRHVGSISGEVLYGKLDVASDSILDAPGTGYWTLNAAMSGTGRVEKTGAASLYINADNTAYTGRWLASEGVLEFQQINAMGSGMLSVRNVATNRIGVTTDVAISNAVAGSGFFEIGPNSGSGASRKLKLLAAAVNPGTTSAGVLTIRNGRTPYTTYRCDVAFTNVNETYSSLAIDVTGANGVAGTDYDQLQMGGGNLTGLDYTDLSVNLAPALYAVSAGMQGKTLVIITNLSGLVSNTPFHSVTYTPGWNGTVTCQTNAVTVTLSTVVSLTGAGVSNIAANSAMGYATLSGSSADMYLLWDTADKGQNPAAWGNTNFLGAGISAGLIEGASITNLVSGQTYTCRFYGTNTTSGFVGWSLPVVFSPVSGAAVDNGGGAISVTPTSALLRGTVLGGAPDPAVWIYWGTADGGESKDAWNLPVLSIGTPGLVAFSTNVTGLSANQQYWYRCYASNVNGAAWATVSTNFTTQAPSLTINTNVALLEGAQGTTTSAVFTLTLSAVSAQPVSVDYATTNGTAMTADNDYVATAGTLTIPVGNLTTQIVVTVNGDNRIELGETLYINLTNAVNAVVSTNRVSVSIINDDFNCYVRGDGAGSDANDGGTWATAFATIQKALDVCIPGVSNNIFVQASSGAQFYDVAGRTAWTSGTYTLGIFGGWDNVGGTPVQTGISRVQDATGPVDQRGINIYCVGDNASQWFSHYVTIDRFVFSNVTEGVHLETLGGTDGCKKSLTIRNSAIYAQGRGLVVRYPQNYRSTGYGLARMNAENVDIVAGLGGGNSQTNHGIYVLGAWNGSGVTASGINAATGEPRVSTITSADGCGIFMLATSISDSETDVGTFSNLVIYGCSSNGICLDGGAAANPDPVAPVLNHCTIADNGVSSGADGVRLLSEASPNLASVTNSIFANNGGHGINTGTNGSAAFPCSENYNVFFNDDIYTNGALQAVWGADTVTTDPLLSTRQAKPDPWYRLSSKLSPAFESASDSGSRGAYQNIRMTSGTIMLIQ